MKIIGITGGVGSGKSRVLTLLKEEYGAVICQTDHVAWELQMPGEICYKRILERYGEEIKNPDETINRGKLGQIVFSNVQDLSDLNDIMHPAVKTRVLEKISEARKQEVLLFVIESALLLEENYDAFCDEVWYIYADEKIRKERLIRDRQYTDDKICAIMATQFSDDIFRENCHVVIDNSGEFDATEKQIKEILT